MKIFCKGNIQLSKEALIKKNKLRIKKNITPIKKVILYLKSSFKCSF